MKLGKNCRFSKTCKLFSFWAKLNFLKNSTTALYLLDFTRFFNLHLVYLIMQIYPVTREWDEANWLDPFISRGHNGHPLLFWYHGRISALGSDLPPQKHWVKEACHDMRTPMNEFLTPIARLKVPHQNLAVTHNSTNLATPWLTSVIS